MKSKILRETKVSSKNISRNDIEMGLIEHSDHKNAVHPVVFYFLIFISLGLPNLIFSGISWFDTLHLMKWTFAMVPIAIISAIGGVSIALYGNERTDFKIDLFGFLWLIMLGYISIQTLWVGITSWSTYMKEWFFFATLAAIYIFSFNLFKDAKAHRMVLWTANLNAGLNVIFAELLIRNMNGSFPFIMNVPGNYIGNTGQQEMFGLWMAMAVMNGIYLNAAYSKDLKDISSQSRLLHIFKYMNLGLLALTSWGMWNSTTRAGFLSLIAGTIIISIVFIRNDRKQMLKKVGQGVAIVLLMLVLNTGMSYFGFGRAYDLLNKTMDMVMNPGSFGKRRGIWKTSWAIFMEHPIKGVGIGHYKWHYLKGQRIAFQKDPKMEWQFTYWAHNEYLQWFAEFGIFGAVLLISVAVWWIWRFIKFMLQKKMLSIEASWACAMLSLILFDAIFSRPFHRIENVVWLSFAFAIVNRELLPYSYTWSEVRHTPIYRVLGVFICTISLFGLVFLGNGLVGNKYLRYATDTDQAELQAQYIDKAKA
ncbi:MAG: O-antigen ligase family protein, partial [Synergistaceae bacterium]|nr:O-antigen ligase family protein [Synergistaceae bacterium]